MENGPALLRRAILCVDKPPNMSLLAVGSDPLIAPPLTARFTEASGDASLRRDNPFFFKKAVFSRLLGCGSPHQ